ncbi:anti-sigma factor [Parasphingorhabdus cellanae]|uniref:Anti-sigma factor n=1 Tax=Parasphingorhabdus cellanae TaxID=2806553 RepID=A0ABX7T7V2_9SPHN|nr:anti-sigma factor [Parasphingorhabdus cellanae]QTD56295.1 anti-sigma factor [Parasphingorhabdus cellanae]
MVEETEPLTDDEALAAELVLGLLDGDDKAVALRKQLADPAFAKAVDDWNRRVDPLFQEFQEAEPAPAVWAGIERRLDSESLSGASDGIVVQMKRWRTGAIVSGALAACLALAIIVSPASLMSPSEPQSVAVAQLTGDIEGLVLAVSYNPETAEMRVDVNGMPETETEPELWIVDNDGVPRSLGQIGRQGISEMTVPRDHRELLNSAATLELSMEPPSDVPHAKPTGEPVATGKITII